MNFEFSEDCQAIATQLRRVLEKVCAMDEVKRCLDKDCASEITWRALADMGVLGAAVPARWGGSGLSALELAACAEEVGRACAPVPLLASAVLATEALLHAGDDALRERWLPALARGEATGTLVFEAPDLTLRGGCVSGSLPRVVAGAAADFVVAPCAGGLVLVELSGRGVRRKALHVLDPGFPLAAVDLEGVSALELNPSDGESAADLLAALRNRGAALLAFEQLGGAERALKMARDYSLQRRTFGRFVGSYQAIKHKLANIWVKNELARGHAYHAAWALAHNPRALPLAAAGARVAASAAFEFAAQENIQIHGGFGYTWEADCHPLYKRALSTSLALGAPSVWKRRIVAHLATARGSRDGL